MDVVVIGGGPAGLYFASLMKRADPAHRVRVFERNGADDTFGWGVVFSDQTLGNLKLADPESYRRIEESFAHWDDIDIFVKGRRITSSGHGFCGISRRKLLNILQERAQALGVELSFRSEIADDAAFAGADLVVAADGVNSLTRSRHAAQFGPDLDRRRARFIWLGTTRLFDAFTFIFRENEHGLFQVHAYRFDRELSTFIVECDEASWRAAGLDRMSTEQSIAYCEALFADWLDGHRLMSNARHLRGSAWIEFVRVSNRSWHHGNIVLMGDAAHTAHFSIGSGTKLALEDAIGLAQALREAPDLPRALRQYEETRRVEVLRLQNAARNSMEWFENVKRYWRLEPEQFAYSLLTRSQRVSHENLRLRDAGYVEGVERWLAGRADGAAARGANRPPPPMFTPFRLRGMTLANRVVVSPMAMYAAEDGTPNDFHLVHLGSRAQGGAGLVFTEMTCVAPEGRITPGCTGMYRDEHVAAWRRIVAFVHRASAARICLQLGHAGRKGSVKRPWQGGGDDVALDEGNWPLLAPSALPHAPHMQVPRAMTRADMDAVRGQFVRAARMGDQAGFDMLELHFAHGYLLSSFITPLANRREDEYGGTLENRLRFPLEVIAAVRAAWPAEKPLSVRISATDWVAGGIDGDEAVAIARAFKGAGVDIVDVSAGQTSTEARPVYGRMFQTPYSDRIRNEAGLPTIAVGNITEFDQVNGIIAAGRADLCALARPHLADPYWTLHAALAQGFDEQPWPVQYLAGREQAMREQARAAAGAGREGI